MAYYSLMPTLLMADSLIVILYYIYLPYSWSATNTITKGFSTLLISSPVLLWQINGWVTLIMNYLTYSAYAARLSGPDSAFNGAASTALFFPIITLILTSATYFSYSACSTAAAFNSGGTGSCSGSISGVSADLVTVFAGLTGSLALFQLILYFVNGSAVTNFYVKWN